ncbi:MAG: GPR endopeptidase [Oscillospiraceae bacterium]|nr:GPR endopeptidase [Oscillospiraceae bacterium]
MNTNRTDLAFEAISSQSADGADIRKTRINGLLLTEIRLDKNNPVGKPGGFYITLHCGTRDERAESNALSHALKALIPSMGKILVAGLGNVNITPDSLGVRAVSRVVATAHLAENNEFKELGMREVFSVEPGVLAQTGIESGEQLKFIIDGIKPVMAVVIDSLACAEPERLGRIIQITDTGIAPGSGVGNARHEISKQTLGIPVVAIGVPTVIDLSSIAPNIGKTCEAMVVPRDIDVMISHFAKVVARTVNRVLLPMLTENEIEKLRF